MESIEDIRRIVGPIAEKHGVNKVYVFGSYAKGTADNDSDIDLLVDSGKIKNYFDLGEFYMDLREAFDKEIDIVTTGANRSFLSKIEGDAVLVFSA